MPSPEAQFQYAIRLTGPTMLVWRQVYKRMRGGYSWPAFRQGQNGVLWYAWPAPETNTRTGQPGTGVGVAVVTTYSLDGLGAQLALNDWARGFDSPSGRPSPASPGRALAGRAFRQEPAALAGRAFRQEPAALAVGERARAAAGRIRRHHDGLSLGRQPA